MEQKTTRKEQINRSRLKMIERLKREYNCETRADADNIYNLLRLTKKYNEELYDVMWETLKQKRGIS